MTQPAGWCTNWEAYDLPRLWQMVASEDDEQGWTQVQAWFRLHDAVDEHRQRLYACRQALQEQWPPEQSEASTAFIAYLDSLLASMTETATSAEKTARGLGGIMNALGSAKAEIKPLYDEWQATSADLTPRWWNHAEDDINTKARDAMRRAERSVADYLPMINIPTRFELRGRIDSGASFPAPISEDGGAIANTAPPPATLGDRVTLPPVPHSPPAPLPGINPVLPQGGPVLSGISEPVTTPIGGQVASPTTSPGNGLPAGHGIAVPPMASPLPGHAPALGYTAASKAGQTRSSGRPMTPGVPSGPPALQASRQSSNGAGHSPTGMPLTPSTASTNGTALRGSTGRSATTASSSTSYRTSDGHVATLSTAAHGFGRASVRPGDPWAVDRGVTPVIEPPDPRPHDPGPGIIGLDR